MAGVVVGLAAPWYVAVTLRDPSFASQFFIDHHFKRFLTEDYHASPVWFYLPVLLVGGLPWSVLLPSLLRFLFSRSPGVGTLRFPALGFWLLWAGWCVLFFSLSRGKLPPYILPAVPALALLVGWYLDLVLFSPATARPLHRARTSIPRQTVVLLAAAWLVGNLWAWSGGLVDPWEAHELIESALCVACIIAMAGWGRKLSPRVAWAFCGVLGFALLCETVNEFVPAWSAQRAPLARPEEVAAQLEDGRTGVVCVGDEWGSIPFCLGRDDHLLNGTGRPTREVKEFLSRNARNLLALIVLLLLAAVVAGIVVLASSSNSNQTNLDHVVKDNVQDQLNSLKQIVEDNTQ